MPGVAEVRQRKRAQQNHHHHRRHRNEKGQTACVFWPEEIQRADDHNRKPRPVFRMIHAQVRKGGERADSGGDDVIRDQKKRADDGDDFRTMTHAGVHAAAVGVVLADGHVIHPDQRREQAHRRNQPERTVSRDGKRQTDDVSLAGAPVAVQDRRRARSIHIARPLRGRCDHNLLKICIAAKTALGEMKTSLIALNVHAGEVSCRAGTIKCSRRQAPQAPFVPQRETDISVSPLIAPKCGHLADKLTSSLNIQRRKARSACLPNASQPAVFRSHVRRRRQCFRKCHNKSKKMATCKRTKPMIMGTIRNRDFQTCGACNRV